jgi:hypothetical protein
MFVRRKVSTAGTTYYNIVAGKRYGAKVKQIPILSLGPHEKPEEALVAWKAKLSTLKKRQARPAGYEPTGLVERTELERVGPMIAKLEGRIAKLADLIKRGEV